MWQLGGQPLQWTEPCTKVYLLKVTQSISSYQGPSSNSHILLKGASHAPMTLVLYYVAFAIYNDTRVSGVPEVSCDQSQVMGCLLCPSGKQFYLLITGKQSLFSTRILQGQSTSKKKTVVDSNIYPATVTLLNSYSRGGCP